MRIAVDGIRIVFPAKLKITRGIVWIKVLKKHYDFASVSVARAMWTYKGDTNSASEEDKKRTLIFDNIKRFII